MNISPYHIKELDANEVLVFGSNEAGIHGAGLARKARKFGAVLGQGVGMQGKTYAIPTKDMNIRTLPIDRIKPYVDEFIDFANNNLQHKFLVTKLGCGLAGYTAKDIAPLFVEAVDKPNIWLPAEFIDELISTGMYNQAQKEQYSEIDNIIDTEPSWATAYHTDMKESTLDSDSSDHISLEQFEEYFEGIFKQKAEEINENALIIMQGCLDQGAVIRSALRLNLCDNPECVSCRMYDKLLKKTPF